MRNTSPAMLFLILGAFGCANQDESSGKNASNTQVPSIPTQSNSPLDDLRTKAKPKKVYKLQWTLPERWELAKVPFRTYGERHKNRFELEGTGFHHVFDLDTKSQPLEESDKFRPITPLLNSSMKGDISVAVSSDSYGNSFKQVWLQDWQEKEDSRYANEYKIMSDRVMKGREKDIKPVTFYTVRYGADEDANLFSAKIAKSRKDIRSFIFEREGVYQYPFERTILGRCVKGGYIVFEFDENKLIDDALRKIPVSIVEIDEE